MSSVMPPHQPTFGLQDVAAFHVEQHAKSPARGLVFAGGDEQAARYVAAQFRVAPVVVGRQGLLDPLEAELLVRLARQPRGVLDVQAHPAIEH